MTGKKNSSGFCGTELGKTAVLWAGERELCVCLRADGNRGSSRFCGKINKDVLDLYLIHGYIPAPYSIYEGIYKLEPGKSCVWKALSGLEDRNLLVNGRNCKKGQEQPFTGSRQEASEELERLLTESIRGQMMADVPLGAFCQQESTALLSFP